MDCGRCRGAGRVAGAGGTRCGAEDWLSCSQLFILLPELWTVSRPVDSCAGRSWLRSRGMSRDPLPSGRLREDSPNGYWTSWSRA